MQHISAKYENGAVKPQVKILCLAKSNSSFFVGRPPCSQRFPAQIQFLRCVSDP